LFSFLSTFYEKYAVILNLSFVYFAEFLATDQEARVRFPALPEYKKVVGLERRSLSLVSITEQLLERKVASPVQKIENTA
jgi:hypothetical protein